MIDYAPSATFDGEVAPGGARVYRAGQGLAEAPWWRRLWRRTPEATFASHPLFVTEAFRWLADDCQPIIVAPCVHGRPVAAFPMAVSGDGRSAQTVPVFSDYWEPSFAPESMETALNGWLDALQALRIAVCRTGSAARDSRWLPALLRVAGRRGIRIEYESPKTCPRLKLAPGAWTSYVAGRRRLRRHLSALARNQTVETRRWPAWKPLDPVLDFFFEHHLHRFEKTPYRRPARRRFLKSFLKRARRRGLASLHVLTVDGRLAAVALWLRTGSTRFFLNGAWDPAHRALGPGKLLHAAVVRDSFESGAGGVLDYMSGEEPYKFDFANETIETVRLRFRVGVR